MPSTKYLSIYVNDHLAALTALREVARRSARSNRGSDLGRYLDEVGDELADSLGELSRVAAGLGIRRDPFKRSAAWLAEKLGRLKLNGHLVSYSPLSRVLEIEGLQAGAEIELATWHALGGVSARDLSPLIERCERRRDALAHHHAGAAALALGGEAASRTP